MLPPRELPHLGPVRLPETSPVPALVRRLLLALALVLLVVAVIWVDRDGLRDHAQGGRPLGLTDVLYFTVVSLTTLGYGDISPVTTEARLLNALLLTPIRIFLWVLFLGTAYEMGVLRLQLREERHMRELHERLRNHVIVCGYGVKGRAIVSELVAHGQEKANIVVIDPSEEAVAQAAREGLVALRGDGSSEDLLKAAAIERAAYVLAATNRDDACVLICLTVRSLAPTVELVAAAREEENVKLLYSAGANLVVAPSVSGGRLMASAVRQQAVPHFLEDVLAFGDGLAIAEREVRPEEGGRFAHELPDLADALILGVARGRERCPFYQLAQYPLQPGDLIVYLAGDPDCQRRDTRA
ncbi:MAG: potassium channel family protein [Chloroflexia bacterium]|nr:potassium channel family protein [Chloroflexia bacterium]